MGDDFHTSPRFEELAGEGLASPKNVVDDDVSGIAGLSWRTSTGVAYSSIVAPVHG